MQREQVWLQKNSNCITLNISRYFSNKRLAGDSWGRPGACGRCVGDLWYSVHWGSEVSNSIEMNERPYGVTEGEGGSLLQPIRRACCQGEWRHAHLGSSGVATRQQVSTVVSRFGGLWLSYVSVILINTAVTFRAGWFTPVAACNVLSSKEPGTWKSPTLKLNLLWCRRSGAAH